MIISKIAKNVFEESSGPVTLDKIATFLDTLLDSVRISERDTLMTLNMLVSLARALNNAGMREKAVVVLFKVQETCESVPQIPNTKTMLVIALRAFMEKDLGNHPKARDLLGQATMLGMRSGEADDTIRWGNYLTNWDVSDEEPYTEIRSSVPNLTEDNPLISASGVSKKRIAEYLEFKQKEREEEGAQEEDSNSDSEPEFLASSTMTIKFGATALQDLSDAHNRQRPRPQGSLKIFDWSTADDEAD